LKAPPGEPRSIRDLVIEPSRGGYNFVTGEVLLGSAYRPFAFYAARPFVASPNVHADSVLDYVKSMATHDPQIMYRHPWWRASSFVFVAAAATGIFLVGGIWPTIVNLICFGSLRRPRPPEDAYD